MLNGGHLALGVTIGALATLLVFFLLEMFSTVITISNEYWAAMIGALSGGFFSMLALGYDHHNKKLEREAAERTHKLALAYSLFECLGEITANVGSLHRHMTSCLDKVKTHKFPSIAYSMQPIAGSPERIRMQYEHKSLLLSENCIDLYNLIGTFDLVVNSQFDGFDRAQIDRGRLLELSDLKKSPEGWAISFSEENREEVVGRELVLSEQFKSLERDLEGLLKRGLKAQDWTGKLIRQLGNENFQFAIKENYLEKFGAKIDDW